MRRRYQVRNDWPGSGTLGELRHDRGVIAPARIVVRLLADAALLSAIGFLAIVSMVFGAGPFH